MAERLRHVAVQHDVERQALGNPLCEPAPDALGEGGEPRIRRWTAPTYRERKVAVGALKVERSDVITDRAGKFVRIDPLGTDNRRQQHLEIAARQYLARRGNVAGIAGKLHAVFGSAER